MGLSIEAIYQDGVIKPLAKLELPENERLKVEITCFPEKVISLRGIWKDVGTVSDEEIEEAKKLWGKGLKKQLRMLKSP